LRGRRRNVGYPRHLRGVPRGVRCAWRSGLPPRSAWRWPKDVTCSLSSTSGDARGPGRFHATGAFANRGSSR